jgi:murein DD-endopeptidase MepM/ murein hydrolase activator NlpD
MKTIIRLSENDLTNLVRRVIIEKTKINIKSKRLNEVYSDKAIEFLRQLVGKKETSTDTTKSTSSEIEGVDLNLDSSQKLSSPLKSFKVGSNFGMVRPGLDTVRPHSGVDLYAATGTEIYSPANGKVVKADMGENFGCGGSIWINHNNGLESRFCHCSKIKVNLGDNVKRGQLVGLTGGGVSDPGRGFSTGPHLHYTLAKNGQLVDPVPYIKIS